MSKNNIIDLDPRENQFYKIQMKVQDEIEDAFEDLAKIHKDKDMNTIAVTYFLLFWTRIMMRYGQHGEKWDNSHLIKQFNRIMSGDIPKPHGDKL